MEVSNLSEFMSLLWPDLGKLKEVKQVVSEDDCMVSNLELSEIAKALSPDSIHLVSIRDILTNFSEDIDVINYRLDIVEDLLQNPIIVSCFKKILPLLDEMAIVSSRKISHEVLLQETASRVGELETYVTCILELKKAFDDAGTNLKSDGLKKLYKAVKGVTEDNIFRSMEKELPELLKGLRKISSVTLGINFNAKLNPIEFTIVSINEEPYKENTLLNRLFNKKSSEQYTGISPIVTIEAVETLKYNQVIKEPNPFHVAIFRELDKITQSAAKPIAQAIAKYIKINARLLLDIRTDMVFLLGMEKLISNMKKSGLRMCKPKVLQKEKRQCSIKGMYNINLALNMHYKDPQVDLTTKIISNDVNFDENGRIFILTGPNQGGKTTYTQAIGLTQILLQLGSYVPCDKAAMSPVDRIYTHFPVEERPDSRLGRLGEESKRLNDIFQKATGYSLILLNESLQSTSPYEGFYISKEVTMALKLLGARSVFATHFHELAEDLENLNSNLPGDSKIVSLISGVIENSDDSDLEAAKRTYRIVPGLPQGKSYAKDIASRHGLSFEKLACTLKDRDIIEEVPPTLL
ncbi:MutS-related protein [Pseudobacteroides cellulosolvens]|uniref:DNA mismatch repair protein MutS domain protein n=1 Tax=Pseudobacteroides cellulosolvens ATCC 35603 = DSM 2933 TaxID=398512 RepID=A0A0L6JU16_9FIRM|nr:hypothetical protein [Pseudobacteroides cellulosolvens]KNY29170.1 DNA mismatch repair protein MutS domain protein [Pseudobacteroides cellulosolvens ATCC 35603 = DSM 2933]